MNEVSFKPHELMVPTLEMRAEANGYKASAVMRPDRTGWDYTMHAPDGSPCDAEWGSCRTWREAAISLTESFARVAGAGIQLKGGQS